MSDEPFEKNGQDGQQGQEGQNIQDQGTQEQGAQERGAQEQSVQEQQEQSTQAQEQNVQEQKEQGAQAQVQNVQDPMNKGTEQNLQGGPVSGKKPNTLLDILLGIALPAAAYLLFWLFTIIRVPAIITLLFDFVILVALGFLSVKLMRKGHKPAGITMLFLITPGILVLLIMGACAALFIPY